MIQPPSSPAGRRLPFDGLPGRNKAEIAAAVFRIAGLQIAGVERREDPRALAERISVLDLLGPERCEALRRFVPGALAGMEVHLNAGGNVTPAEFDRLGGLVAAQFDSGGSGG